MLNKILGKKKNKFPTQPVPRALDEVRKEYTQLAFDLGQAQYQVLIYTQATKTLSERMKLVNQEAEARNKLDAEAKAAEVKPVQ